LALNLCLARRWRPFSAQLVAVGPYCGEGKRADTTKKVKFS